MGTAANRLTNEARKLIGKSWGKSSLTRQKLLQNVRSIANNMASQGLQHIDNMKSKHVERFFDSLKEKELSASTMQNYATAMRVIAAAIGKSAIVPETNKALGITRTERYQPISANLDKMTSIREQLSLKDERLAAAFDMRDAFGLRAKESLLSKQVVERDGKQYLNVEGTKGGRPRQVAIENEKQLQAIEQVQRIINAQGTTSIIPKDMDLKQFYNYQKNTISALGARRADGSNMHAQRHSFAQKETANGKSSGEVQAELGHGEERTLRHYVP